MGIEHSTIEFELPTEACVLENCWYFNSFYVFSIILLIIFDEPVKSSNNTNVCHSRESGNPEVCKSLKF